MAEDLFQQLKQKYVSGLSVLNRENFRIHNLHVEGERLVIKADAPSQEATKKFWDAIKTVDSNFAKDLNAQISVRPPQAATPPPAGGVRPEVKPASFSPEQKPAAAQAQTYTVIKGDTLSGIAKHFYGNANEYMRIFEANRDQLKDPDKIQVGQVLKIPADTKV